MSKAKPSREKSPAPRDETAALAAQEALEMLECIREDLSAIEQFVDTELAAVKNGRRVTTKRLARLRLVAQDLDSAHRLTGRSPRA